MNGFTIIGLAVALALDALAVAVATGIVLGAASGRQLFRLSFHFGLFQAIMPVLGWLAGRTVHHLIAQYDHWIAFGLLAWIGGKMIRDAFGDDDEESAGDPTRGWSLVVLSVATSIDALAVGLSLSLLGTDIWYPSVVIGLVAAAFTLVGMRFGGRLGIKFGKKVEAAGGVVLILIAVRIVIEHTMG